MMIDRDARTGRIRTPACRGSAPSSAATASSPRCECLWVDPDAGARRAAFLAATQADASRSRRGTPSRARSCTRCAAARWRRSARSRSAATTAASTPRRCSSCWPAPTTSAPATCALHRVALAATSSAALAWIDDYGDRDGDGFVEYAAQSTDRAGPAGLEGLARLGLPRRRHAGRRRRSRCARCRATSTPRDAPRADLAARPRRRCAGRRQLRAPGRAAARSASRRPSGARSSAPTRWRSTATSSPCRVRTSNAGHCLFTGIAAPRARARAWREALLIAPSASPAGACARSRPARRATTRCPTTTARSGRTTTR